MAKSPSPPPGDEEKKIADADWLMSESAKAKPKPKPRTATPGTSRPQADEDHSYDLVEGHDEPADAGAPPPAFPDPLAPVAPRRPKPKADAAETAPAGPPATVDQVWSRGAEWGFQLVVLGVVAAIVGFLLYLTVLAGQYFIAFLIMAFGGAVLLALCYPIFITLERPVRITPEQAAKDYYAMLSHPFPHYQRMWLLLSSAGRAAPEFSSYGEFKIYWKRRLSALQGKKASSLNPLKFQVADFHSEKSAGMTALNAKYTVKVFRGEPTTANEVASILISTSLVKGPDRMWYLNSGTLPDERK